LNLSEQEIKEGIAYLVAAEIEGKEWDELSEDEKSAEISLANFYLQLMEDDLFSFCVQSVAGAYIVNGKVEEASTALEEAKTQMKELSDKYSDYEHYPNLKEYYTTTRAFLEFCNDPNGSFEQLKDTINDYRNDARECISDLDYVFEE